MEKTGGSRLLQMQARFQQKQLQEREMKIASLYETQQARALDRVRQSPSNRVVNAGKTSPPDEPRVPVHPGKVRQMFEERRTKKGIDKSYPLQPIHNTERVARKVTNGHTKVTTSHSKITEKKKQVATKIVEKRINKQDNNLTNGSGDLNHNHQVDLSAVKRALPQSNGELIPSVDELDRADNNYLIENETFPEAMAPTPTPRSPEPVEPKRPPRRSPANKNSPVKSKPQPQPVAPPRKTASDNGPVRKPPVLKSHRAGTRRGVTATATAGSIAASAGGAGSATTGTPCAICGRRFAPDRLQRHQEICKKANAKKRKPFDALKHRLAGTEAEPFINKLRKNTTATANPSSTKVNKPLNNNWRQKHEEFIQAIRAAKQVQAHLNAGGKLSDLPPPPPSENPDYVQCPHCQRRFNQAAAERHIPKCASYQFNKPKPPARKR